MNDSTASTAPAKSSDSHTIYYRASAILLKLLDGIERDIDAGTLPSPHMAAYEALCRAEAARPGG